MSIFRRLPSSRSRLRSLYPAIASGVIFAKSLSLDEQILYGHSHALVMGDVMDDLRQVDFDDSFLTELAEIIQRQ